MVLPLGDDRAAARKLRRDRVALAVDARLQADLLERGLRLLDGQAGHIRHGLIHVRLLRLGIRRLHAEVRQDVRHHFADGGRSHLAAADVDAGAAARRIEQHEDDDLRIVRRSKADE